MSDLQLTISTEERNVLNDVLAVALKETRVEEHRTRTPSYREHVIEREKVLEALLKRLG